MENDKPLKWKPKLTAELARGECVEYDVAEWERGEEVTLGSLGLSLAEGKAILAEIQTQMVATQIEGPNCGLWRGSSLLRSVRAQTAEQRPLPLHIPVRVRQRARAGSAREGVPGLRTESRRPAVHAQVFHRSGTPLLELQAGSADEIGRAHV